MNRTQIAKQCSICGEWKSPSEFYKRPTTEDGLRMDCKKCVINRVKKYGQIHRTEILEHHKEYALTHKVERNRRGKRYYRTITGHLRQCFNSIKQRCNNPKCPSYKNYGERGIRCLFESVDEFIDYVLDVLKTDPCNLAIHRIDNNSHYMPDNIEFLTMSEHSRLHMRKQKHE